LSSKKCCKKEDIVKMYLSERTIESNNKHIHSEILFCDFEKWYQETHNDKNVMTRNAFSYQLSKYHQLVYVRMNGIAKNGIKNLSLVNKNPINFENCVKKYVSNHIVNEQEKHVIWLSIRLHFKNWYLKNYDHNVPDANNVYIYLVKNVFKFDSERYRYKGASHRGWKHFALVQ
jgi:hypothetical protein